MSNPQYQRVIVGEGILWLIRTHRGQVEIIDDQAEIVCQAVSHDVALQKLAMLLAQGRKNQAAQAQPTGRFVVYVPCGAPGTPFSKVYDTRPTPERVASDIVAERNLDDGQIRQVHESLGVPFNAANYDGYQEALGDSDQTMNKEYKP